MRNEYDVIVVGSGPNGLAAATLAADAGLGVLVIEAADTLGGGARTAELTEPGFHHDICSHAHPMGKASPFFADFDLTAHGVELLVPPIQYAHPLTATRAAYAYKDLDRTCAELGVDGHAWRSLMQRVTLHHDAIVALALSDLRSLPANPLRAVAFAVGVAEQASPWWNARFASGLAPALLAGVAAHSMSQPQALGPAAVGLLLAGLAHTGGWPIPRGGSGEITAALVQHIAERGGEFQTGWRVQSLAELPRARAVMLDTSPLDALTILGDLAPASYRRQIEGYRYGAGVCKVDFAVSDPVPWRNPRLGQAGTVHLGGTRDDVVDAERSIAQGVSPEVPFMMVGQPHVVDVARAPAGKFTVWAYAHVPHGSPRDFTPEMTSRIESFAPGFKDTIIASSTMTATDVATHNPNYVGGDLGCGATSVDQILARPVLRFDPYSTPVDGVYLCSAATPPGPGVHGMCGVHAMRRALAKNLK